MSKNIIIIGSGFAGLAAACKAAKAGHKVTVVEKNEQPGGRASTFVHQGFLFDKGPSWYWMPEVFENFFNLFGKKTTDYYRLIRLDPSYRIFFTSGEKLSVPANVEELKKIFEQLEKGSAKHLDIFLREAKIKYDTALSEFIWKPGHSIKEFASLTLLAKAIKLQIFKNMSSHLRSHFSHPQILQLLEFPVLFLGAKPSAIPALYSMMNYADLVLGTWYPSGGIGEVPKAMYKLAKELNVQFYFSAEAKKIVVSDGKAKAVELERETLPADAVISTADYFFTESNLLSPQHRNYPAEYWTRKVMSPSSLIFYVGISKKIKNLLHHNLFFDEDFDQHAREIYDEPQWPTSPLFYVCVPSVTDSTVAPDGMENLFILIPVAAGLNSNEELRQTYFNMCIKRIEKHTGESLSNHILFMKSYAHEEFSNDYHSFKGNAYGLANTLMQTAFMKPKMRNKHVRNLFYAGQLTVPGPGVPPTIISGQIAADEADMFLQQL